MLSEIYNIFHAYIYISYIFSPDNKLTSKTKQKEDAGHIETDFP